MDDGADNREPVFFNKQMLIDFKPSDIRITWVLDDKHRPFGFEFIRSANFLEVNFGPREGEEMFFDVAGEHIQRAGFPLCRECGSVQSRQAAAGKAEAKHLKSCSFGRGPKKLPSGREDAGIENCLYLYRRFSSEALRILLPRLATGGTEEQVNSFVAARFSWALNGVSAVRWITCGWPTKANPSGKPTSAAILWCFTIRCRGNRLSSRASEPSGKHAGSVSSGLSGHGAVRLL
ncbi:hypothetical protein HLB35_00200 [Halomonas sp. TBZ9]|uniref:Uncharacterized protein n=1 Tax=Vreelandella azerica TaxID=2732867 RepID=A0A7Y3TUP3_9GAMM|nr:hypothetical protein [Halomonas azerica]NOG30581.1 hypothetical protein [Halomonas azerica]